MATHKSALKAHSQSTARRDHNRQLRTKLRHALKTIRAAVDAGGTSAAKAALRETFSIVDKMAGKGLIHRNAAGRYKSRLTRRLAGKSATA